MSDKYKPLRDACDQLKAEASAQGAINPRSQLILELLQDYDASIAREAELRKELDNHASNAELMAMINDRRIGIEFEYEGPAIATVWGDEPDPIATAEGDTAQEAVREAVALADAKEAAQSAGGDH